MESSSVKDRIIASARVVFRNKGFIIITMDDLAKQCGMGRSSLYHYYKNKVDVFKEVVIIEIDDILGMAQIGIDDSKTLGDNLLRYTNNKLECLNKKLDEFGTLLEDLRRLPDLLTNLQSLIIEKERVLFKKLFNWALDRQEIAPLDPEELDSLVLAVVTALGSLEKEFFLNGLVKDPHNRLKWLINLLLRGLSNSRC
ncbi:transcriptional regulator, TetR family [bacterium A37T11]|nr:transcriptional regulator, TetR family [bacterium A37T11]